MPWTPIPVRDRETEFTGSTASNSNPVVQSHSFVYPAQPAKWSGDESLT